MAQAPQKVSYQSVIRDHSGVLVKSGTVAMRISIVQGSASGTAVYTETQTVSTNVNGLASLEVGTGTAVLGIFSEIDWSNSPYFLKVETDPAGGITYSISGTSEILSVPYALHATTADSLINTQWTTIDTNIYYNKGNVGIGTSSPEKTLDVSGTMRVVNESNSSDLNNYGFGNFYSYSSLALGDLTSNSYWSISHRKPGHSEQDHSFALEYYDGGSSWEQLLNITSNGNVGIGVKIPTAKLDVEGNINLNFHYITNLTDPSNIHDAATKGYVDLNAVAISGDQTITGSKIFNRDIVANNLTIGKGGYAQAANVAVGVNALSANIEGGVDNTALGFMALSKNTIGSRNTAEGSSALQENETGNDNTAIGYHALISNVTGSKNTIIGFNADVANTDLTNATAIGSEAVVNASNKIVLGNASAITIGGYGAWSNYSDRRLKENIVYKNDLGLNFITGLKTVSYNYKNDSNKRRRDGLIAQDVQQTLKELNIDFSGLIIDDDKDKTLNLSYSDFVIPLINAVQEQQKKIESLESRLAKLELLLESGSSK
jgi:hypothetical protein